METKYHHGDLKDILIEKGLVMILEEGITNLSLRKLAKACNVSEAAPYAHFKSKEQLLEEMANFVTDKLYKALVDTYENSINKDKPRSILEMGEAYILFFIEHPHYFNFIFTQPSVIIDLSMNDNTSYKPYEYFKEKSYLIYRKEGLSDEKIKYGIIGMWSKVHGIASIATLKNVRSDFKWKDKLETIIME